MSPRFLPLVKVRVIDPRFYPPNGKSIEGFVIESREKDGRMVTKISMLDGAGEAFENWYPEESLERCP